MQSTLDQQVDDFVLALAKGGQQHAPFAVIHIDAHIQQRGHAPDIAMTCGLAQGVAQLRCVLRTHLHQPFFIVIINIAYRHICLSERARVPDSPPPSLYVQTYGVKSANSKPSGAYNVCFYETLYL